MKAKTTVAFDALMYVVTIAFVVFLAVGIAAAIMVIGHAAWLAVVGI